MAESQNPVPPVQIAALAAQAGAPQAGAPSSFRVIGIDTSLRSTGLAVVEAEGQRFKALCYGLVKNPSPMPLSQCLAHLRHDIAGLVGEFHPDAAAIEGIFYAKNVRTAMILCHARGVAIDACSEAGIPVFEYEPRRVKQAVLGVGSATKEQIQRIVTATLGLQKIPPEDAADALAIALAHLHNRNRLALGLDKPL